MQRSLSLKWTANITIASSLLLLGFIPSGRAAAPPIPKGIFCMPPMDGSGYSDQILDDPRIVGVDMGACWGSNLETTEGVYDWSSIQDKITDAESHGKKILLRIISGGINVPSWLLQNPNVQTFTFINQNPNQPTYQQQMTMPVFWDPIFLEKKLELIAAAGAQFASDPNIQVVTCSFANSTTGDWNIPRTPEDVANWLAAGYTTDKMVAAGKAIIDATMAAFPNQNVALSFGVGAPGLDPTPDYLAQTVINYATTTYGRFITEKNSLSDMTPDPATNSGQLANWQVIFDQAPNASTQMLAAVTGDTDFRMNHGTPADGSAVLTKAITTGADYGSQFEEIYASDLENPAFSSAVDYAYALLTATPSLPAAPDNLVATCTSPTQVTLTWNDNANNELGYRIEYRPGATGDYQVVTTVGPNLTTTTIKGVVEGSNYFYRVRAVNASGFSDYSNEAPVTTGLKSPSKLTALALSSSQVSLTWSDNSTNETGFIIERSPLTNTSYTVIATVGANTTAFTDTGLTEGTKYWYRVHAYNAETTSGYTNEKSVTTLSNVPAAPSALKVTSLLASKATLVWTDNSTNESGFRLQRKLGATGTYADIKTTVANVTTYTDKALTDGATYYYRVCATNPAGDSAYSAEVAATTVLNAPKSLTAQALSSSQVKLTWTDNSASETSFIIERSPLTDTSFSVVGTVGANITSFTDSGLTAATKYWYRVRASNASTTSSYSNEKSATTLANLPAPPSGLTITSLLSNKIMLTWVDNSNNESGFIIQRKTGATGTYVDIRTTVANMTGYNDNDTALKDGTTYYYRVCAANSAGDSAFSNEVSGTTPLQKPTLATATAVSSSSIKITWVDNSSSETGYKIERKITAAGTYTEIAEVGANSQSYSDTSLTPQTRYYYRVRATNGTIDSDYSNQPYAVTLP